MGGYWTVAEVSTNNGKKRNFNFANSISIEQASKFRIVWKRA
jgi:hypothetical protein